MLIEGNGDTASSTSHRIEETVDLIEDKEDFVRLRYVHKRFPGITSLLYTRFPLGFHHLLTSSPHL